MNFNKLAKESYANAVKHGFWEKTREQRALFDACRFGDWRNG